MKFQQIHSFSKFQLVCCDCCYSRNNNIRSIKMPDYISDLKVLAILNNLCVLYIAYPTSLCVPQKWKLTNLIPPWELC